MATQVSYTLDNGTIVKFETDPVDQWQQVSPDKVISGIREAIEPLVEGAAAISDRLRSLSPDEITVKFGVKVSGTANWVVAKAATEGNFEVALKWTSEQKS